jgi:carotenoid cleavage dioxygenase-like enzyme
VTQIVIYACASKNPALNTPANTTPQEHFQQNLTGPDGGLMSRLTEWRVNLKTGVVTEKLLVPRNFTADMPRINENYTGLRNKYGYGLVTNTELTVREGMPLHTEIVKYYLPDSENTQVRKGAFVPISERSH